MTNVGIRHMMYADVCHIEIHEGKNEETNENHISEFNTENPLYWLMWISSIIHTHLKRL